MAVWGVDVVKALLQAESPTVAVKEPHGGACIAGDAAPFVVVDVGESVAYDFVARPGLDLNGDLVGHGAGWTKQRRFVPHQRGTTSLKRANAGVFREDVVADLRGVHGRFHGFCWARDGVAPKSTSKSEEGLKLESELIVP